MPEFQKITPHLWFTNQAEQAAALYVSLFPDSGIDNVTDIPADSPSGPAGSVKIIEFTLAGQRFTAFNAGPLEPFNHAISLVVSCADQAEIDHYWNGLLAGGEAEQCGWLKDRYGVSWQVVPAVLAEMMKDPDRARAPRGRGDAEYGQAGHSRPATGLRAKSCVPLIRIGALPCFLVLHRGWRATCSCAGRWALGAGKGTLSLPTHLHLRGRDRFGAPWMIVSEKPQ